MNNKVNYFKDIKNLKSSGLPLIILYVLMVLFFSIFNKNYLSITNFKLMAFGFSVLGIVSVGEFIPLIAGVYDLSIGGTISLVCIFIPYMLSKGFSVALVVLLSLLIGIFVGILNGFICNIVKINPIITTLGTLSILSGGSKLISTISPTVNVSNQAFLLIGQPMLGNVIPIIFVYMVIIYIFISVILKYTSFGRNLYAVGGNFEMSRIIGINPIKIQFISFVISGFFASFGAVILVSQMSAGRPEFGSHFALDALTVCVLGGLLLGAGKGDLFGLFMAVVLLGSITNGLVMLNITSYVRFVVSGSILIISIIINQLRFKSRE